MSGSLWQVLEYMLLPVVAGVVGGVLTAFWRPGKLLQSAIQHFAAGVVFAAAAVALLPKVKQDSPLVAIIGFALGIIVIATLRWLTRRAKSSGQHGGAPGGTSPGGFPLGFVATVGLDIAIDGMVAGAAFATGSQIGLLLTIALSLEFLFLGLSVAGNLGEQASRWRLIGIPSGVSALVLVGATAGYLLFRGASPAVVGAALAFGAVAFMYLVTEELLTEAHEAAKSGWSVLLFFIGFLIYLLLDELLGR